MQTNVNGFWTPQLSRIQVSASLRLHDAHKLHTSQVVDDTDDKTPKIQATFLKHSM